MNRSTFPRQRIVLVASLIWISGCAAGGPSKLKEANVADRQGRHHVAYDAYCAAAAKNPGSASLAANIRRVAPLAARYWEAHALAFYDQGRMMDAWRTGMRVLEIQPDHASAIQLVLRIERDYPVETLAARRSWERYRVGHPIPPDRFAGLDAGRDRTPVAAMDSPDERARSIRSEPVAAANADLVGSTESTPPETIPVDPGPPATVASNSPRRPRTVPDRRASRIVEPTEERSPQADLDAVPRAYRFGVRHRVPSDPRRRVRPEYLVRHILSRDDDRYEASVQTIDGFSIRLRDTDRDPLDADLDIHIGKRRIARLRDIPVNRSIPIKGRSGREYMLDVLAVRDATETVIFAIRAVRR